MKTKNFDCRPALNPSRIFRGFENPPEILKILLKSTKMLINLNLGRLRASEFHSNLLELLELQNLDFGRGLLHQIHGPHGSHIYSIPSNDCQIEA